MKTEYQVRPVTRYIVTRYESPTTTDEMLSGPSQSSVVGEFASGQQADLVADAMVAKDQADGIESSRSRHGLSLGEVISGQRLEQGE
ncbi:MULTISPECIES: hypothetical protein [Pseudomonas putida group]|uniref:hypothetical protein n=1 Tax=Pseudomonas putida group TaxID=136845 RepID=UPI0015DC19C5|nr:MULTISPECIES: hypothetical protein [Pseudomonas putida group]MCL8299396.1 hypothetical protein [Pseudomonas mosselii]MCL8339748.1 hypothetical protein [Pseudomonas mosselii]BBR53509.1 hypothetical protein WP4W18C03_18360 [Pseudomonas putida]